MRELPAQKGVAGDERGVWAQFRTEHGDEVRKCRLGGKPVQASRAAEAADFLALDFPS